MRLLKREMPNARIIGGDCKVLLSKMIDKHSVQAAHVYFPDPWWKKRHHKRRLFTTEFCDLLADVIKPEGHLHSWTDVIEYFEVIKETGDCHPKFVSLEPPAERDPEDDLDYQTSFERKKRKMGLPIYRALWQRQPLAAD